MAGSPSLCWPASIRRVTTSRTWAAVTTVSSSAGPRRTASSTAVQDVRPGSSAAMTEYGQPGIICACPFPRAYTWQNKRSGLVAAPGRSQLLTSTASTRRPSAARGSTSPAPPPVLDPAVVPRVIQRAVPAPVLRCQRQADQGPHRPVGEQHRVRQVEQRIRPRGEATVKLPPERRQPVPRPVVFPLRLDPALQPPHTARHGHRHHLRDLWKEPEDDHAVAASRHGNTPDKIDDLRVSGQPRLNGKLSADRLGERRGAARRDGLV